MRKPQFSLFWLMGVLLMSGTASAQGEPPYNDQATVVRFVGMEYPGLARAKKIEGVVVMRATLGDDGGVESVAAISGSRDLVAAAVANQRKWYYGRLRPKSRYQIVVVYDFRLQSGRCAAGAQSLFVLRDDRYVSVTDCQSGP
jgi:TonB family protein